MINSLGFEESWSIIQFCGHAYPIRSKEQKRMYIANCIFETSSLTFLFDRYKIKKSYGLKLQISHEIPSKLQFALKDLENDFYILIYMLTVIIIWRPATKVYGAFTIDLFVTRLNPS